MNNQAQKQVKLQITFGKKPRASASSKKYSYRGMNFFLHKSTAETKGNIYLYNDDKPYPLIACFAMGKDDTQETVTNWIEVNFDNIKARLNSISDSIQIPWEIWKKGK